VYKYCCKYDIRLFTTFSVVLLLPASTTVLDQYWYLVLVELHGTYSTTVVLVLVPVLVPVSLLPRYCTTGASTVLVLVRLQTQTELGPTQVQSKTASVESEVACEAPADAPWGNCCALASSPALYQQTSLSMYQSTFVPQTH
jgi:hypothetical protein